MLHDAGWDRFQKLHKLPSNAGKEAKTDHARYDGCDGARG
jgi:hypothetical protein